MFRFQGGFFLATCTLAFLAGCSRPESDSLITEGAVISLVVHNAPIGAGQFLISTPEGSAGFRAFTKYEDDGKTTVSVYPTLIVVHQSDGADRVVPHGWYEHLVLK